MIKLKPLLKDGKPLGRFGVVDIETAAWVNFLLIGYFDGEHYAVYEKMEEFFDFLFSSYETPQNIFAHFGGKFDFLFLFDHVFGDGKYAITDCIPRGSGLLCFTLTRNGRSICFRDSSAILSFSLFELTKTFGVKHKKQKIDHSKTTKVTKELKEYLKYDCIGLWESIQKYSENPLITRAGFAFTDASQALRIFRTFLEEPLSGIYGKNDEYIRDCYFGGRVEVFKPLFDDACGINYFDINSLYPYVLSKKENDFPGATAGKTNKIDFGKPGFYECTVKVKEQYLPPLPLLQNGKLIFPVGRFRGKWSVPELQYALSNGATIEKVHSGIRCHSVGNIFREFIEEMYSLRMDAKKRGDGVMDITCKGAMNKVYGRFGLRKDRENIAFDSNQEAFSGKWTLKKGAKEYRVGTVPVELTSSFSNVAIAAYTTSYARIENHKTANPWAEKSLYYTDTDSFFTPLELKTGEKLGQLKKENKSKILQACFLLPKTYILKAEKDDFKIVLENDDPDNPTKTNKKVVMKGFNSRKIWRDLDINQFKTGLEGNLKLLSVTNEPKFATFKRALKKNKIITMLDAETRGIKSVYSKRIIYKNNSGNYDTRPIVVK